MPSVPIRMLDYTRRSAAADMSVASTRLTTSPVRVGVVSIMALKRLDDHGVGVRWKPTGTASIAIAPTDVEKAAACEVVWPISSVIHLQLRAGHGLTNTLA